MKSKKGFKNKRKGGRKDREFDQILVEVARVARVMKGGRRFGFRATVVIGDRKSKVAMGIAKGSDVTIAVNKAVRQAKRNFVQVPIVNGTIPHEITIKAGGAKVFLKPARPGTGIIAGGGVRAVAELSGIKDLLSKTLGSSSKINNVRATLEAFKALQMPNDIAKKRGKDVKDISKIKVAKKTAPDKSKEVKKNKKKAVKDTKDIEKAEKKEKK